MIGRIYRIISPNTENVYIGSTTLSLAKRFSVHNSKRSCTSQIILDCDEASIELLEEIEVVDKYELRYYENLYIGIYRDIAVNMLSACERKLSNAERWSKYYQKNGEKAREQKKLYIEKNRDKIREQKKLYREKNKEKIREQKKLYYQKNRDKKSKN